MPHDTEQARWIPEQPPKDLCANHPDAPFCGGPSLRECPGGIEVAEGQPCPGNDTGAVGDTCEADGTCDDSCTPPARDDCLADQTGIGQAHVTVPPHDVQLAELPATGAGADVLLLAAAAMIAAGADLVYRRRRKGRR